jgi:hypothetical protein
MSFVIFSSFLSSFFSSLMGFFSKLISISSKVSLTFSLLILFSFSDFILISSNLTVSTNNSSPSILSILDTCNFLFLLPS